VLLGRCYHIPDAMLSPENVRVILDCGANVGITALYFASRYPNARIYSVEPNEKNFEMLKRNTAAEPRIVPIRGAVVGHSRTTVRLTMGKPAWGNFISEVDEGQEVPAFTIDQILEDNGLQCADLLKVDIEGAEKEVFANNQFMSQVGFVIVELHNDYRFDDFSRDVARLGFRAVAPKDQRDLKMIVAEPLGSVNVQPTFQLPTIAAVR
jgi:FkbM family methyltransferase